jgi:putative membrane protein
MEGRREAPFQIPRNKSETMLTDMLLAISHHLVAFTLVALLAAETLAISQALDCPGIRRLVVLDRLYGIAAGLMIIVGGLRVGYGVKDSSFYLLNALFWAKMLAFGVVAMFSVVPTITYIRWMKQLKLDSNFCPSGHEILRVRRFVRLQLIVFALIPVFAAAMARGYGFWA